MFDLKTVLACAMGLGFSVALTACDVDEGNCDEAGICECTDAEICEDIDSGAGGGGGARYSHVVIVDTSDVENAAGTPGVDICGMTVDCDTGSATAADATLDEGSGDICRAGAGCSADRGDASAAEDDGAACDAESAPSDYVSVGVSGTLTLRLSANDPITVGCSVNISEHAGRDAESYDVYVCTEHIDPADATDGQCTKLGQRAGGSASFEVVE